MPTSDRRQFYHRRDPLLPVRLISTSFLSYQPNANYRQVVLRKITIELNVLSHLFEFVAGSLILARLKFNLHMVTLPRGWFLQLLQQINVREADTILLDRLVISLNQLLHDLVCGGVGARKSAF